MNEKTILLIYDEKVLDIGKETFIHSIADNGNCVVFEDDGTTGYFYAVDKSDDFKVLDGLHVYDVESISDKHIPSTIKILWTTDGTKCVLSINDYYHAVFDFEN